MVPYNKFSWFYPPRTGNRSPFKGPVIDAWRTFKDSIAQFKMNGDNCQVVIFPDRKIEMWSRHKVNGIPKPIRGNYRPQKELSDKILAVAPTGDFTILNAELLHWRTPLVKNNLYIFDVLVWKSQWLIGEDYKSRYALISGMPTDGPIPLLCGDRNQLERAAALGSNNLFIAENFGCEQWEWAWQQARRNDFIEGLFLKRMGPTSRLEGGFSEINNAGWGCRVRKATKNILF